ncbi:YIP1 family protein [Bacillus sp. CLL-7-23]|uniref:YIP1 family protein n=1 Tax=Bacillus changyiensis TaxID=3004103 RepID=A0ABT4X4C0_9BACI|nr:YIP1 family protein [Bacillus changyiensis]MDA7026286.1 YIP1 family protein [Bacillus changyiensis]
MNQSIGNLKKPSLFGMITNPMKQFERIKERSTIWLPFIIVLILLSLSNHLEKSKFIELLNVDVDAYRYMILFFRTLLYSAIFFVIWALVMWLIAKIGEGKTNFSTMFSLSIYVSFVVVISKFILSIIFYLTGSLEMLSLTSLNGYISVDQPIQSVLGMIDIFYIWTFILIAFGLQKIAGVSKRVSWIGVAVLFALLLLCGYLLGMFILMLENSISKM